MRRAVVAILVIALLWAVTLAAFPLFVLNGYAPRSWWILLILGLWLMALVVYAALLNAEGRFSRYLIVASVALVAAVIVVAPLMAMLTGRGPQVPPG
jgi:hypothetical protein